MFGMFGKKESKKEDAIEKESTMDYLSRIAKDMSERVKKSGKEDKVSFIHLTCAPTGKDIDKRAMCAIIGGDPKGLSTMLVAAMEEDDSFGKIVIASAIAASYNNSELKEFMDSILKVSNSDSVRSFLNLHGDNEQKRKTFAGGLSIDDIKNMSEEDIEKFVKKIIEDAEGN